MGRQWHQPDHMQVICTLLQTDDHASTSSLSFFTGWMPFLLPNQQHQSTEGAKNVKKYKQAHNKIKNWICKHQIQFTWAKSTVTTTHSSSSTCDISRQGNFPTWAPVKPYTEFALILRASCRPSNTFFLKGSVSSFRSSLALTTKKYTQATTKYCTTYFLCSNNSLQNDSKHDAK